MLKMRLRWFAVAFGLTLGVGCSGITHPADLDEFDWAPLDNPASRESEAAAYSALSLLYIQGTVLTPSPCYGLSADFEKKGNTLIFRVSASVASGSSCTGPGAFQYTASMNDLKRRTYDLRVIYDVEGGTGDEHNLTVTVVQ